MLMNPEHKPLGLIALCAAHAAEATFNFERRRQETGQPQDEIRLVRHDEIVLSLATAERRGQNKCARCRSVDWDSMEIWRGPQAHMASLIRPAWGAVDGEA
jgi:hypothetical protein